MSSIATEFLTPQPEPIKRPVWGLHFIKDTSTLDGTTEYPPAGFKLAWGARAIYSNKLIGERCKASIELLFDRQEMVGGKLPERRAFAKWIDKARRQLVAHCQREGIPTSSSLVIEYESDGYKLVASPNGSFGYMYITAWQVMS